MRQQFQMIAATIGMDQHIGLQIGGGRFDEHMHLGSRTDAAAGVANDPARRVARRYRDQRFSGLERDIGDTARAGINRSEEHTSELQSLMRISYAVFCLKKK